MAHGQPDFGMYAIASTIYKLVDMGELAARLGSPVLHDRRGDVIFFDDFEDGLYKWKKSGTGTGNAQEISVDYAKSGIFSCKLTTGDAANNSSTIQRYLAYPVLSKIGVEVSFTFYDGNIKLFAVSSQLYDGANVISPVIYIYRALNKVTYLDSAGAEQTLISSLDPFAIENLFHTAKLVVDFENRYYTRFILDDTEYDMSTYPVRASVSTTYNHLIVTLTLITNIDASVSNYLEDVIITQNEP